MKFSAQTFHTDAIRQYLCLSVMSLDGDKTVIDNMKAFPVENGYLNTGAYW